MNIVQEVKKKKEFSGLPDSVVVRALDAARVANVLEERILMRVVCVILVLLGGALFVLGVLL